MQMRRVRKRSGFRLLGLPGLFPGVPGVQPPRRTTWTGVVTLDPGLGGTGWAYWDYQHNQERAPSAVGIVRDKIKNDTLAARCEALASSLVFTLNNFDRLIPASRSSTAVIIEFPQHMASAAGIAAQAGSVYKLTFLCGYLACSLQPCDVHVVTPQEWKGQLPKTIIQSRLERVLGKKTCRDLGIKTHAWDAVGIGLWAMGRL